MRSKINSVPQNSAQSSFKEKKTTSWHDISECKKREAEKTAKNFLADLLNDVDTIATGTVVQQSSPSSCSVISLYVSSSNDNEHEDHRLVNWKRWLEIRERDSKNFSKATLRHRKELLVNLNPNNYRKILMQKGIVEKAIFNAGDLNFWRMPVKTREGLFVTSPKSQQTCKKPEIVYTQTPDALLNEQKLKKQEDKITLKVLKLIDERKKTQLIKTESFEAYQPRMEKLALTGKELQQESDIKPLCIRPVRKLFSITIKKYF